MNSNSYQSNSPFSSGWVRLAVRLLYGLLTASRTVDRGTICQSAYPKLVIGSLPTRYNCGGMAVERACYKRVQLKWMWWQDYEEAKFQLTWLRQHGREEAKLKTNYNRALRSKSQNNYVELRGAQS